METVAGPRRFLTATAITGILYTLSWIAGLSVGAPGVAVNASGAEVVTAFEGHRSVVVVQFLCTEGLPAAGLVIIALVLARAARGPGVAAVVRTAGVVAATVSLVQCGLGIVLAGATASGTAHVLYDAVNRLDGVKMFALAVLAVAAAVSGVLPRWLRYAAAALAVAIVVSGVGYLLLVPGLAAVAYVSGVLLLVFVTATGIVLGRRTS
ncbi:hypothetical protein [Actinomadura sp. DC4]|uniref:hypothetical protein n=1 Tax=Actinomadura sp. DC4 TaxID=3055069 RepID=UPI0025B0FF79|nr:hypothetical protein [Actinomadura sp. DC4]MDN3355061.1 hypothetical protein [Actinomadura sp. DC4]